MRELAAAVFPSGENTNLTRKRNTLTADTRYAAISWPAGQRNFPARAPPRR